MKGQGRSWKLKRMAMDSDDTMQLKKGQQAQADKRQQDLERFMQVFVSSSFLLLTPLLSSSHLFFQACLIQSLPESRGFGQHVTDAVLISVFDSRQRQYAVLGYL